MPMPAIVGNGSCGGGFGRWGGVVGEPAPALATESEDEGGFPRSAPGPTNHMFQEILWQMLG